MLIALLFVPIFYLTFYLLEMSKEYVLHASCRVKTLWGSICEVIAKVITRTKQPMEEEPSISKIAPILNLCH